MTQYQKIKMPVSPGYQVQAWEKLPIYQLLKQALANSFEHVAKMSRLHKYDFGRQMVFCLQHALGDFLIAADDGLGQCTKTNKLMRITRAKKSIHESIAMYRIAKESCQISTEKYIDQIDILVEALSQTETWRHAIDARLTPQAAKYL